MTVDGSVATFVLKDFWAYVRPWESIWATNKGSAKPMSYEIYEFL